MTTVGTATESELTPMVPNGEVPDGPNGSRTVNGSRPTFLARRKWPFITTVAFVIVGLAFMFAWMPVVNHQAAWYTGDDLWGIFRGAHYVGWGYLGGVYAPGNGIVSFPGIAVVLAPVAMVSGRLHLSESYGSIILLRPTAALLLQPIELLLTATVIFASDALAECLHVPAKRRIALCFAVGAVAWPVAAIWGHAEDALAMTFAMYAMVAVANRKWARCGWLLGLAIVIQPLAALLIPLFVGTVPAGKRVGTAIRAVALSAVLVGVAFIGNPDGTYQQLVDQPTPPKINHATPWAALAPILTRSMAVTTSSAQRAFRSGHLVFIKATTTAHTSVLVAGGPGRMIDVLLALLVGIYAWRRPQEGSRIVWLALIVLSSRCFFEAVMTPYYLAPPLFLGLVMASRQGAIRFWAATVIAMEVTIFAYHHLGPWAWWLPVVVGLAAMVALGFPSETASLSHPESRSESSDSVGESFDDGQVEPALVAPADHELQPAG
jgi:hypothetical protein